jgi:hypothetical protein
MQGCSRIVQGANWKIWLEIRLFKDCKVFLLNACERENAKELIKKSRL